MLETTGLIGEQLFVVGSMAQLSFVGGAVGGVALAALGVRRDGRVVAEGDRSRASRPTY